MPVLDLSRAVPSLASGVQMRKGWCGMTHVELLSMQIAIASLIVGIIALVITLIKKH